MLFNKTEEFTKYSIVKIMQRAIQSGNWLLLYEFMIQGLNINYEMMMSVVKNLKIPNKIILTIFNKFIAEYVGCLNKQDSKQLLNNIGNLFAPFFVKNPFLMDNLTFNSEKDQEAAEELMLALIKGVKKHRIRSAILLMQAMYPTEIPT